MRGRHTQKFSSCGQNDINEGNLCTLVTARFAGGSYLNKVELQNGCLALGHSNLSCYQIKVYSLRMRSTYFLM